MHLCRRSIPAREADRFRVAVSAVNYAGILEIIEANEREDSL